MMHGPINIKFIVYIAFHNIVVCLIYNNEILGSIFYQLYAQILYFNTFITFIYMFRALLCSSSGGQIALVQHLLSSPSLGDYSVHRLRGDSRNLWSEQSPKESDDTRCRVNTIVLMKMSTIVLETCRGI